MDEIEIKVELINEDLLESYQELEKLQRTIKSKLHSVLGLDAKITLLEPRSIERFVGKAKRVIDERTR